MHRSDHIGSRETQHLVTAFERGATKVIRAEIEILDECAEGAIEHDDPLIDRLQVGLWAHWLLRLLPPAERWLNELAAELCHHQGSMRAQLEVERSKC